MASKPMFLRVYRQLALSVMVVLVCAVLRLTADCFLAYWFLVGTSGKHGITGKK